jgi:hypothetical protein
MQHHVWKQDDMLDLQRVPRTTGSGTSSEDLPQQHLQCRYRETIRLVVLMEDPVMHTEDHPCCFCDPGCPCHGDVETIALVNSWFEQGQLTQAEATLFLWGKTL